MKKMNYILTLLLLAVGATWAMADDHTLSLGNYDEVVAGDWNEDQCYQGSWWMITPTQFNVKHTGSQFIYTKEQLAQMAGKEIKGMSFVFYNQGTFGVSSDYADANIDYKVHTMYAQAQISKTFLFITPFVGLRGLVSKCDNSWDWAFSG